MAFLRPAAVFALSIAMACGAASMAQAADAPGPLHSAKMLQITLPSHDLDRSIAFYRDVLGLELLFRVPGAVFFDAGGVRLRLELNRIAPGAGDELYFDDPGLVRAAALKARGMVFSSPVEVVQRTATADLEIQDFEDPDGNQLALMGQVTRVR
jgi:catechol 2,3-dioxygenase-like lactoylglutathione lyase family enzyme